jgi:protocatechuate 3,4-dioxygenase beta subunit
MLTRRNALVGMASSLVGISTGAIAQLKPTPLSSIGPFYPVVRGVDADNDLTLVSGSTGRALGQIIEVSGRVLDRRGNPVSGATVEIWQANAVGRYAHPSDTNPLPLDPNFQGFAKLLSGHDGHFRYITVKPGSYPDGDDSPRPPHIHHDVVGKSDRLITEMLFPEEPLNETDDVVPAWARPRLTATARGVSSDGALRFEWDVILDRG